MLVRKFSIAVYIKVTIPHLECAFSSVKFTEWTWRPLQN